MPPEPASESREPAAHAESRAIPFPVEPAALVAIRSDLKTGHSLINAASVSFLLSAYDAQAELLEEFSDALGSAALHIIKDSARKFGLESIAKLAIAMIETSLVDPSVDNDYIRAVRQILDVAQKGALL